MTDTDTDADRLRKLSSALLRYQILSYITAVGLILLLVAWPLKRLAGIPEPMSIIGPAHGLVYMVYLLCVFDLGNKVGWPFRRSVLVMLAGAVPLASVFVERAVYRKLSGQIAAGGVNVGPDHGA